MNLVIAMFSILGSGGSTAYTLTWYHYHPQRLWSQLLLLRRHTELLSVVDVCLLLLILLVLLLPPPLPLLLLLLMLLLGLLWLLLWLLPLQLLCLLQRLLLWLLMLPPAIFTAILWMLYGVSEVSVGFFSHSWIQIASQHVWYLVTHGMAWSLSQGRIWLINYVSHAWSECMWLLACFKWTFEIQVVEMSVRPPY